MEDWNYQREPTSPGEILQEEFLVPLGLTQKQCAEHLGVDVKVINRIINGKSSVTPKMAVLLGSAFDISAEFWLNAQLAADLWKIRNEKLNLPGSIAKHVSNRETGRTEL